MSDLPNKAYDLEYSTMWKREKDYLESKGILPVFIKRTPDYKIKVYKYTKTSQLFNILSEYFSLIEKEKYELNKEVLIDG